MGGVKERALLCILKDKASILKASISTKRTTSSIQIVVIRATTHDGMFPPPEHLINAVLAFGHGSRPTASACIEAIVDRLKNTRNAYVALKCLIIFHNIISKGSFILKDQLSFYLSTGPGRNFLNLTKFTDQTDVGTWEFSPWVRWYATVLERNLVTSRALGSFFSFASSTKVDIVKAANYLTSLLNSDLLKEMDALVMMIEEISGAPEYSSDLQHNDLVYEVVRLVGEDSRLTQYHIMIRLKEFGDRMEVLSDAETDELRSCLKGLKDCREGLMAVFMKKIRNDPFWDMISQTDIKLVRMKEERERVKEERERALLNVEKKEEASESSLLEKRMVEPSQLFKFFVCCHVKVKN